MLEVAALDAFLGAHPDAKLIDVREVYEHLAAGAGGWNGNFVYSVPLSRFAGHLAQWLGANGPLVFFCRSGARGAKAAACMHQLGYADAWYVQGVLVLENPKIGRALVAA